MLNSADSIEQVSSEISTRISMLNDMSEADLKNEMRDLKQALKENPSACALLMDEDIGKLVTALRRLTKKEIEQAETKPKRGTKEKVPQVKLTAEQLAAALDDDDF